jgi:hypothetical protein
MNVDLMFEAGKRVGEYVGDMFVAGDMFDGERVFIEIVSKELMIPDIDMFGPLIIGFWVGDSLGDFVVRVQDRRR